jgi:hypothetical protein
MDVLTEREMAMLDFAGRWYKYTGAQEQAMRDEFELSATRFWQVFNLLIERPAALAYAPTTVNRYRRLRAERQAARSLRRLAG